MKALEILKEIENAFDMCGVEAKNIHKAIEELKALENRSCSTCKHSKKEIELEDTRYMCLHDNICFNSYTPYGFYCKYWEEKQ